MNGLLVLILAASVGDDEPQKIMIHQETGRVHLEAAADDSTMKEIPNTTRILFMLPANKVSPEGLKQLSHLRQIEFLRLNHSSHGDAALQALANHPVLRTLKMWSDTGVTATGVKALSTVASLRSLDFTDVPLDQAALESIPAHVEYLTISRCKMGDAGLAALPLFPNLKGITVKYDGQVTDAGLMAFIERHRCLEGLAVDVASDRFLASLVKLPNLKSLWLGGSPITVTGLQTIGRLEKLDRFTISSDLSDEMRTRVKRLPNHGLDYVGHRGQHIYLVRDRALPKAQ